MSILLDPEDYLVNFGALLMPSNYAVMWSSGCEHYIAVRLDGTWEGSISCDRFWCRRQAIWHSEQQIKVIRA